MDDGFAVAVGLTRSLPARRMRLEQEAPERVHRERELEDQVAERVESPNVLGLVSERAREHLIGEAAGEGRSDEHARLEPPVRAEREALVIGDDDALLQAGEPRVARDDSRDPLPKRAGSVGRR